MPGHEYLDIRNVCLEIRASLGGDFDPPPYFCSKLVIYKHAKKVLRTFCFSEDIRLQSSKLAKFALSTTSPLHVSRNIFAKTKHFEKPV